VGTFSLANTTASYYNIVINYGSASNYDLGYNNTILSANCDAAFAGAYNDIAIFPQNNFEFFLDSLSNLVVHSFLRISLHLPCLTVFH
jgi:hypothetical protein